MIHGTLVDVDGLIRKYGIDAHLGRSMAPLHSVSSMEMVEHLPEVALPPVSVTLAGAMLPNEVSMEWLGRKFKLSGLEMTGLYAIMHGPTGRHFNALVAITTFVLDKVNLDPPPNDEVVCILVNLIVWATSYDET